MNYNHIKVLLIEDNPGDARLISEMLASAKEVLIELDKVDRISLGLEKISEGGFDVILSDLSLPDSRGLATFEKVHSFAPTLPIIVLSGTDDEELAVKAVQEGAQDYLVKGRVDSNLLVRSIRYAIERKQVEEAYLASTTRWQTTFDTIEDSICILDSEKRIIQCNKATYNLIGKPVEQILGQECCTLIHELYKTEPTKECPFALMQESKTRESIVLPLGERWFNITVDPIIDKTANLVGAVHILSDITERKRAQEQLIQSEKLAGIGTLASGIAHEINNPLAGIMGYAEIIMYGRNPEQTSKYAEKIMKEAERTADIVKWLSRYSRQVKDDNITKLDLIDVINESFEALKHTRKSFDIEIEKIFEKIPTIKGNRSELMQVFVNLINNAVDAMPEGGKLRVSTVKNGRFVETKVSDNGQGIPEDKMNRIFEPFFTTKEVGEGTGLGLYVTSMMVKKHHGQIGVESEVGKGTTFTLRFPISGVTN